MKLKKPKLIKLKFIIPAIILFLSLTIILIGSILAHAEDTESDLANQKELRDVVITPEFNDLIRYTGSVSSEHLLSENQYGQTRDCYLLANDEQIEYTFNVLEEGDYNIAVSYYPFEETLATLDISVMVNNEFQFAEAESIRLMLDWADDGDPLVNRYGDEVVSRQSIIKRWYNERIHDNKGNNVYPYVFHFTKGINTICITNLRTDFVISDVYLTKEYKAPSYEDYISSHQSNLINQLNTYEAEIISAKNKSSLIAEAAYDPSLSPYDTRYQKINLIGYTAFDTRGDEVSWNINAPETGFYYLTFKSKQMESEMINTPVFRTIKIDGAVPFEELENYKFNYSSKWVNNTLSDDNGNHYMIYLEKGVHRLSMTVNNTRYLKVLEDIEFVNDEVNDLALQLKKMTGNTSDKNRDWEMEEYIPDIAQKFTHWEELISSSYNYLKSLSVDGKESKASVTLKEASNSLKTLAKKPNDLPNQLNALSDGSSSVIFMLTSSLDYILYQAYAIDKFYLHGDVDLPTPNVSFTKKLSDGVKRFFYTFLPDPYEETEKSTNEVTVWVNRSRSYVNALQQLIDTEFTPQTGIKVTLSIMPSEDKVILANASKTNPDMAIGLSTDMPFELGIKGAIVDLAAMDGFNELMRQFQAGAFLSYVIDDSIYGMPETQDFWCLFYRSDILNKLNLSVPDTWEDVVAMLPTLQRYGMNFVPNLSNFAAYKPFSATLPYIWQNGGDVVSSDGLTTTITDENALKGIKFMTDLFTLYSTPESVPNFYSHFKLGDYPIGIGNITTYLQLTYAADEIAGKWAIAPLPGVKNEDGEVMRYAPGSAACSVIFNNSDKINEAWEFLKWYMEEDTQIEYANILNTQFGEGNIWNTANVKAFEHISLPDEDKKVILEQWEWLVELPRVPGHYMIERQLSDVWNKVVYNGANVREAADDAAIKINREIFRKMTDYKYIIDGEIVKEYRVPTVEMLENWGK